MWVLGNPSLIAETDFQNRFREFLYKQKGVLLKYRKGWSAQISGKDMFSPFKEGF